MKKAYTKGDSENCTSVITYLWTGKKSTESVFLIMCSLLHDILLLQPIVSEVLTALSSFVKWLSQRPF